MTHSELVQIAYKWVLKNASCGVAFKELKSASLWGEIADVIGFGSHHSVLIECKVTKSDFLSDKRKIFRKKPELGIGKLRYYCCPQGLIKVEELPAGWGLIYVNESGKAIVEHKPLKKVIDEDGSEHNQWYYQEFCVRSEHALMYSALRRLHLRGRVEEIYELPKKNYEYR